MNRFLRSGIVRAISVFMGLAALSLRANVALTTVYSFTSTEGGDPVDGLIQGSDGKLYGAATGGYPVATDSSSKTYPPGIIFTISADGTGYTVLHTFNARGFNGTANSGGDSPNGHPVFGSDGALYGVTFQGGSTGYGVFYKLNTDGTGYSHLWDFNATGGNFNTNPEYTEGPVIRASNGNFYGTGGGPGNFNGYLYGINQAGTAVNLVYGFVSKSTLGGYPYNPVIEGLDGRLYGLAGADSTNSVPGFVFAVNKDGTGMTSLHTFGSTQDTPYDGLIQGSDGMLYGTTNSGADGTATVFKIKPDGTSFTVLHTLNASTEGTWCSGPLLLASDGKLYGGALQGAANAVGSVFSLATDGTGFTVLHTFTGGADHGYPNGGMIQLSDGSIWGTTSDMDNAYTVFGTGSIFKLTGVIVAAAPTVTSLNTSSGATAGGTAVTVTGTGFTGATAVKFGTTSASSFTVVSDTSITTTAPAGSAGTVDVTVTASSGTSATTSADHFTYVAAPTLTGVAPTRGPTAGGTSVTLTGTGFSGATAVRFGGTAAATFTVVGATSITATAPAGTAGTVDITVTTVGGTSATGASDQYTYVSAPVVTAVSPASGPLTSGTSVTLTGTHFTGATGVAFGATPAVTFTVTSDTSIAATAPAGTAGTVDIKVTTVGGTSATGASDHYAYVAVPAITGVSPAAGPAAGGTSVTLTGTALSNATAVQFGATAATAFTVTSATSITATAPAGTAGTVDITVTTIGGTSPTSASDQYTFVAAPVVTGISTGDGPLGGTTSVTLTGSHFTGATAVSFGGTGATSFTVNSDTSITATAPAGTAGTVDITVTTVGGTSATGGSDQYTYVSAPVITAVSPPSGPLTSGTAITLTGTHFTGATAVTFGATPAATFTIVSDTSITVTAPAASAGTVDITVTTVGGTSATGASDQYTYTAVPAITGISPAAGPAAGGTSVTLTGTALSNATAVQFGATAATAFTVTSATSITATAPAGTAGTVDITVTTIGGTSPTSASDQYTFVAAPVVTGISTGDGPLGGTTSVTLTGSHFTGATAVSFGGTGATSFTVNSDTSITATAPAGTAGTVDITVTTVGGTSATGGSDQYTYVSAPVITAVSPPSGPLTSGTAITLTGTHFTGATAVTFGATPAATFTIVSDTSITVTAPAASAGTVDITVTTVGGTSATGASDQYTYVAAPTISGVSPAAGPLAGGASITLTGTHFSNATAVSFGGTPAASFTVVSDTSITAQSPAEGSSTVDTLVTTAGGTSATSAADQYAYIAPPAFTSGATANGTYRASYTSTPLYTATATLSPSFGLLTGSLPTGLSLDPSSGAITGTPTQTGTFPVTIRATNPGGTADLNVSVVIGKAATTVDLSNLAQIYDGTPRSATATPGVGGLTVNLTYDTSPTPPATAGTYAVVATISDPNYQGSMSGSLVISPAATAVTWTAPAAITYGTALSATQLNATASVPGTFLYAPASGTVLAAGPRNLAVTFTPTDTVDYTGSTGATTLTVGKATATVALSQLTAIYDGSGKAASATTTPGGLTVNLTYGGSATLPVVAGSYAVVGTISDANYQGSASGTLVIGRASATVTISGTSATYNGQPKPISASTSPGSYPVVITYNGSTIAPTEAGTYRVMATVSDPNFDGFVVGTLVIAQAPQAISFPIPPPPPPGSTITLAATASSGLPVSYAITNGNATLAGRILTPLDSNPVTVTASQPGNSDYLAAAPVVQTIATAKTAQTISVTLPPSTLPTAAQPFTLQATATSGLPVTFTVTGVGVLSAGNLVTLTGSPGQVTIVATQPGDSTYAPASPVTVTVNVTGRRVFVAPLTGTATSSVSSGLHPLAATVIGSIAGSIDAGNTSASVIGYANGVAFAVTASLDANGFFQAVTPALSTGAAAVTGNLTVSGRIVGNVFSGSIPELGASFSATVDPATGPTAGIAGFYQASSLDSSAGTTYSVIGSQGEVLVIAITPGLVTSGSGTVTNNGFTVSGSNGATISGSINPATTQFAGRLTTAGGTTTYSGLSGTTSRTDRLVNLSSRGLVSGSGVLYSGLVIGGTAPKSILLRGIGPGLGAFGVPGFLAQPHLQLFDAHGVVLADNLKWGGASAVIQSFALTGAFPLDPASSDAAVLLSLQPGLYTIVVSNAGNDSGGIAMAEIYDASANPTDEYQRLINISSRAIVGAGAANLTDGFIIAGNNPKRVLIRGVGPALAGFGVANPLADPVLSVFDSSGTVVARNDDWGTPVTVSGTQAAATAGDIVAAEQVTGAFALPVQSADAAVIVTLAPGAYTAQVAGKAGGTGTGLVEIYEIPSN